MSKTIKEIAEELNCSVYNVYAALHSGKLQGTKEGWAWNITDEALQAYKKNKKHRGMTPIYVLHRGDQFGFWTVVDPETVTRKSGARMILCRCICGKEYLVNKYKLIHGDSRSCGCRKAQNCTSTIANKQIPIDKDPEALGYETGYREAQLTILKAYCKKHDVVTISQLQDVAEFIGLSVEETRDALIANDNEKKQHIYDRVTKKAKTQEELIRLLWKNGFVLEDFERYGFSADTVWKTVMEDT